MTKKQPRPMPTDYLQHLPDHEATLLRVWRECSTELKAKIREMMREETGK